MPDPHQREILVNLGNRYVVFGASAVLPGRHRLGPDSVSARFPRVADESEVARERIKESLIVAGGEVIRPPESDAQGDLILVEDGEPSIIEIDVRETDFSREALTEAWNRLMAEARAAAPRREIWTFNLDRLRLRTIWADAQLPHWVDLDPLNVWEFQADGTPFERPRIAREVDDWEMHIENVYRDAEAWSAQAQLRTDRSRKVMMSEELMQLFAVPDRELAVLDVMRADEPLLSLVPAGLWIIGSNGRIDVITRRGTRLLLNRARYPETPRWELIDRQDRTNALPWNEHTFRDLLGLVDAGE